MQVRLQSLSFWEPATRKLGKNMKQCCFKAAYHRVVHFEAFLLLFVLFLGYRVPELKRAALTFQGFGVEPLKQALNVHLTENGVPC